MDFLHSQETLSTIDWILRAIISFFFLLVIAKLLGQRSLSQLRVLDFVLRPKSWTLYWSDINFIPVFLFYAAFNSYSIL